MELGGNWVDLIILGVLLFFFIEGISDRFIPAALNLVGFILTYALALKFYGIPSELVAANFSLPHGIANALGFFIIAMIFEAVWTGVSGLIYGRVPVKLLNSSFTRYF